MDSEEEQQLSRRCVSIYLYLTQTAEGQVYRWNRRTGEEASSVSERTSGDTVLPPGTIELRPLRMLSVLQKYRQKPLNYLQMAHHQ